MIMPPIKGRMSFGGRNADDYIDNKVNSSDRGKKTDRKIRYGYGSSDDRKTSAAGKAQNNKIKSDDDDFCDVSADGFCRVTKLAEAQFTGMISDVGFLPSGELFVCYGDGVAICDRRLKVLRCIAGIKLPGGADVTRDGGLVVVDRFSDTVNVFSADGTKTASFSGGVSPMDVSVDDEGRYLVTDVGDKCVRAFNPVDRTTAYVIRTSGDGYTLQWPFYVHCVRKNSSAANSSNLTANSCSSTARDDKEIVPASSEPVSASNKSTSSQDLGYSIVSDTMLRKLFAFDHRGALARELSLRTLGSHHLLRPRGVAASAGTRTGNKFSGGECAGRGAPCFDGDVIVVIDDTSDSVECFDGADCSHVQTLIDSVDGVRIKPKVLRISDDGRMLVVGGATGVVRLLSIKRIDIGERGGRGEGGGGGGGGVGYLDLMNCRVVLTDCRLGNGMRNAAVAQNVAVLLHNVVATKNVLPKNDAVARNIIATRNVAVIKNVVVSQNVVDDEQESNDGTAERPSHRIESVTGSYESSDKITYVEILCPREKGIDQNDARNGVKPRRVVEERSNKSGCERGKGKSQKGVKTEVNDAIVFDFYELNEKEEEEEEGAKYDCFILDDPVSRDSCVIETASLRDSINVDRLDYPASTMNDPASTTMAHSIDNNVTLETVAINYFANVGRLRTNSCGVVDKNDDHCWLQHHRDDVKGDYVVDDVKGDYVVDDVKGDYVVEGDSRGEDVDQRHDGERVEIRGDNDDDVFEIQGDDGDEIDNDGDVVEIRDIQGEEDDQGGGDDEGDIFDVNCVESDDDSLRHDGKDDCKGDIVELNYIRGDDDNNDDDIQGIDDVDVDVLEVSIVDVCDEYDDDDVNQGDDQGDDDDDDVDDVEVGDVEGVETPPGLVDLDNYDSDCVMVVDYD